MRIGLAAAAMALALLVSGAVYVFAASERVTVLAAYPAPFGYVFSVKLPRVVGLAVEGRYLPYMADTGATGYLFFPVAPEALLTPHGWYKADVTWRNGTPALAIDNGTGTIIVTTVNGYVYESTHRIMYGYPDYYRVGDVIITDTVRMDVPSNASLYIMVPVRDTVRVYNGSLLELPVWRFLGVPPSCVARVHPSKQYPWSGGVVLSPVCVKGLKTILTGSYRGQPLAPVVAKTVRGATVVVVFGPVTVTLLARLHLLSPVNNDPAMHVIAAPQAAGGAEHYYVAVSPTRIIPVKREKGYDATVQQGGKYVCIVPKEAEVLDALLWRPRSVPRGAPFALAPGELVAFRAGGSLYYCHGALDYLHAHVTISYPQVRQLHQPLVIRSTRGKALILLGNARYYYGKEVVIPYSVYNENTVWVVTGKPRIVVMNIPDIWDLPMFWVALITAATIALLYTNRYRRPEKKVKLEWDISEPRPLPLAPEAVIRKHARLYVERFGVCPTDVELALMGVLVPYSGARGDEPVVVCPFRTNPSTELVLRDVVRAAEWGFWALKRTGPSSGYMYTVIGGTLLYYYVYKHEDERDVATLLRNAIASVKRVYIGHSLTSRREYGLIIVTTPQRRWRIVEELARADVVDEDGRVRDLTSFFSAHGINFDNIKDVLPRIKALHVVSSAREAVEVLGRAASEYYMSYLSMRGDPVFGERG